MSALRSQLAWLLNGQANTATALESLGDHLRALQDKVARLEEEIAQLRANQQGGTATTDAVVAQVEALKGQLRTAVDDLGDRVGALKSP